MKTLKEQHVKILRETFGYPEFHPLQKEIIESVLSRNDTLVIMPTGGGKSICYQIPALIFEGLTIVISPLISLMRDQVFQLKQYGIDAVFLNSSLSVEEYRENVSLIRGNRVKLLYVAPETILKPSTLSVLAEIRVDCLAIDEAHCISEWGHDFRPEYRSLAGLRKNFTNASVVALTATATERVRGDIKTSLAFTDSNDFVASFNRKNLFYEAAMKDDPLSQTVGFIRNFPDQSGIIYCLSRDQVDRLSIKLAELGYSAAAYHAGMSDEMRRKNQDLFINDDIKIMVATIAFGMGVHKTNVRFIVHYDLPKSIESYYQETGRAGRDGLDARCLLLYSYSDIHKIKYFIEQMSDEKERRIATLHLNNLIDYAETESCRREPLLHHFGEDYTEENCGMCDNCVNPLKEKIDLSIDAQKFLSCMKRTGEVFGFSHIIDVLRGSKSKKVLKFGHDELSTYGIGKDYSAREWQHLANQLVRKGLIFQDVENYGSLKITNSGYDLMKGNLTFEGYIKGEEKSDILKKNNSHNDELFALLRSKRREIAEDEGVPPYVIFSDKTLTEMCTFFPQNSTELSRIHGVGAAKLSRYGDIFLNIITSFCNENNIKPSVVITGSMKPSKIPKHISTGEAFNSGRSIEGLIEELGVKKRTILDHLNKCVNEGFEIDPEKLLPCLSDDEELHKRIIKAFDKHGVYRLTPVFEELDSQVDYDTLFLYRLYIQTTPVN